MTVAHLDSGGISYLAARSGQALAAIRVFTQQGLWPPRVPTAVLVESLTGSPGQDATVNRLLEGCGIDPAPSEVLARRAAILGLQRDGVRPLMPWRSALPSRVDCAHERP